MRSDGFTFLEVMSVLAIIATLAALSLPALRYYRPAVALQTEARQLASDLRYAQQQTVSEQVVHYIETAASSSSYRLYRDDSPPTLIKTVSFTGGITVHDVTGPADSTFRYNAYGAVSTAGSIMLQNQAGAIQTVAVRPSGYVQVE